MRIQSIKEKNKSYSEVLFYFCFFRIKNYRIIGLVSIKLLLLS